MIRLRSAAPSSMARTLQLPVRTALTVAILGLAMVSLYAGISRGVFLYGDDILLFQVTAAIAERGEVSVTSPARRGDVARSIVGVDGGHYSKYGLAPSLVALPFYCAAPALLDSLELPLTADRWGNLRSGAPVFGTGLTNAAVGGATVAVLFLFALALGHSAAAALSAALALGLATPWLHYSGGFLSEPLSGLALTLVFYGAVRFARAGRSGGWSAGWLLLSGFAAGLTAATKVAHLLLLLPVVVWVAHLAWTEDGWRRRARVVTCWASPFALWLGGIACYNFARFGNVFETGYQGEATRFTTPLLTGLSGLLGAPAKGLFWYCPLLLLALTGWRSFFHRSAGLAITLATASGLHLLLIAKYYSWYGGDAWGPRLLVPLLPLWILPAAEILRAGRERRAWPFLAAGTLVALSLAVSIASVLVPFDSYPARTETDESGALLYAWEAGRSPVVHHLRRAPAAAALTARELSGAANIVSPADRGGVATPDFAFSRYGSHALLEWTRSAFLLSALLLGIAVALVRGDQKALLSRPPQ